MNTRFNMMRPMRRKNNLEGGNTQSPPFNPNKPQGAGLNTRGGGALDTSKPYNSPMGGMDAVRPKPAPYMGGQGGMTYTPGIFGGESGQVSGMPTTGGPSGPPKPINPRQNPNGNGGTTQTPPTWIPPTTSPAPGGGGGGGNNPWSNRVNFDPGHYSSWRPEGWETMSEQDRLAWSNSIRDVNDPMFDQSWGELGDYFSGTMLSMLDPNSARRVARTLDANRAGEQNFGVGIDDFWLNPAMGLNYNDADASYMSADRARTGRSLWDTALSDLMGTAGGMPTGDINQSPLGGLQDMGNQVFDLMENYGLQDGQRQRNRFAESRYGEELEGLLGAMQGTPLEQFSGVLEAFARPQMFRQAASPTRFGMVQPPRGR